MLQFVSGLGPRKADSLVHAVGRAVSLGTHIKEICTDLPGIDSESITILGIWIIRSYDIRERCWFPLNRLRSR